MTRRVQILDTLNADPVQILDTTAASPHPPVWHGPCSSHPANATRGLEHAALLRRGRRRLVDSPVHRSAAAASPLRRTRHRRRDGLSSAVLILLLACVAHTAHATVVDPRTAPRVAHDLYGIDHQLWVTLGGVGHWFTDRAPLTQTTPTVLSVGYATTRRRARLSWRVEFYTGAVEDAAPRFVYADLFSVGTLLADGRLRPWWRVAFGFGLDLVGTRRDLGSEGYFNADNGPSGGMGLTHAWGVDLNLGDWVMRAELGARAFGGAGRTHVMGMGLLGVGYTFHGPQ